MYSDMSKRSISTPSEDGQLLGDFGLADAGWAGEQVGADRLVGLAQARTGQLDRRRQRIDGRVLAEDDPRSSLSRLARTVLVILGHGLRRNPRHGGDGVLDLDVDGLLALFSGSSIWAAPVSSITSMALSGSLRSLM
jgi:hypothetical protein